jgi:hypothetical protein
MQSDRYFVEFTEYSGFGQLTITREFFTEWQKMQRFMRQLPSKSVLDFGEIQAQSAAAQKVAA